MTDTQVDSGAGSETDSVTSLADGAPPAVPASAQPAPFVYALGRIEPRFPSLGLEKEFAQASGRADTAGLSDQQAVRTVLREQRYIARQLCWVFSVGGMETYLLAPRDPRDLDLLVESLRPGPRPTDIDVVIGVRGPIAPPELCGGMVLPIVVFDQLYSFDVDSLIRDMPRPEGMAAEQFEPVAEEVLWRIMQVADNAGAADGHRALNYLSVRYPAIYAQTAQMHARNFSLSSVSVRTSRLAVVRNVVDVVLTYTNRETGVDEPYFVRVDVTDEFPFLVTRLSPYFER